MSSVDVAVAVVVALAALRGFWRGFLREFFGLAALVAGVAAAVQWSAAAAAWMGDGIPGTPVVRDGLAFVAVFVLTHLAVNLAGIVLDRLAAALLLGGVNRAAGAVFGAGKAAAVVAVVLLLAHLFPPLAAFDEQIRASSLGRPLVAAAGAVLRLGLPQRAERTK